MADFWLINGPTALTRSRAGARRIKKEASPMARKHRRSKSSRRSSRSHRRTRRSRHSRRSFLRNPAVSGAAGELMTAVLAGGAGYFAARWASSMVAPMLPSMVPQREAVSQAMSAGIVMAVSEYGLKGRLAPSTRAAIVVGAAIPVAESLANMAGLGRMLGTERLLLLPTPAGAAASSAGVSAALAASLEASLEEDGFAGAY